MKKTRFHAEEVLNTGEGNVKQKKKILKKMTKNDGGGEVMREACVYDESPPATEVNVRQRR